MKKRNPFFLIELIVLISGAVVMIMELTGSRIVAPYIGTSLLVWTSIIGVVLGSLSLGYWFGGKLADKRPSFLILSVILLVAAFSVSLIPLSSSIFIPPLLRQSSDIRSSAVLVSLLLFAVPSIVMGMISPYAIRLKLENLSSSGETAGKLYAISTIGSIIGTFLTGFYLLALFHTSTIFYIIGVIMLLLSLVTAFYTNKIKAMTVLFVIVTGTVLSQALTTNNRQKDFIEVNTPYSNVRIYEYEEASGKVRREMAMGTARMSAMYIGNDELVYEYTKYYRLVDHFNPQVKKALMIGGAGYSYPKDFVAKHPDASIEVIEIDPDVTRLAEAHFNVKRSDRMSIIHEDARTYLNENTKKYDAIFNDAFSTHSIPFQLTTKEAVQKMSDSLTEDGVLITNTISSLHGDRGQFLRAEYFTYKSVFPYVYVFPVQNKNEGTLVQNIMLVAMKKKVPLSSPNEELQEYLSSVVIEEAIAKGPLLTDEFAPVENYELAFTE